jgi:FkbM family methyltransferase
VIFLNKIRLAILKIFRLESFFGLAAFRQGPYKGMVVFTGLKKKDVIRALGSNWQSESWDYEPEVRKIIEKFCHLGMVVFDVGANIGLHTLMMSKMVGFQGKVYAFEPNPQTASLLKETCRVNRLSNVEIIEAAISDKDKKANLLYVFPSDADACLETDGAYYFGEHRPLLRSVPVEALSLDSFVKQRKISRTDFIKIDVQGAERNVISGMHEVTSNLRPVFICEFVGEESVAFGKDFFKARDYYTRELKSNFFGFKVKEARALDKISDGPDFWVDMLAVPLEKMSLCGPQ